METLYLMVRTALEEHSGRPLQNSLVHLSGASISQQWQNHQVEMTLVNLARHWLDFLA